MSRAETLCGGNTVPWCSGAGTQLRSGEEPIKIGGGGSAGQATPHRPAVATTIGHSTVKIASRWRRVIGVSRLRRTTSSAAAAPGGLHLKSNIEGGGRL